MKKLSLALLTLIIPIMVFAQSGRGRCPYRYNLNVLTISPTIGGLGSLSLLDNNENEFHYGYSGGLLFDVRPIQKLSFKTGIMYNKMIDAAEYLSVPLTLNYHIGKSAFMVGAGPVFLFDIYEDGVEIGSPITGYTVGLKYRLFTLNFYGASEDLFHHRDINEIDRVFMIGVNLEIPIRLFWVEGHINRYSW
jgi:hypothetical protein